MSITQQLPDEILTLIFSHVDKKKDKQTVLALRAVNKQYSRLATPLVWCTVIDKINQQRHTNTPQVGPLQRVAWDLVQRPQLARLVKAIRFEDWDFLGKDRVSPLPQGIQSPTSAAYSVALTPANLPDNVKRAILEQLGEETPAGHLSLLLALCTKLEVLVVPSGCGQFSRLITRILLGESENGLQTALPPQPSSVARSSLRCLRELNTANNFHGDSVVRDVLPLLCLPSLHDLHIYGLGDSPKRTGHTLPDLPKSCLTHNPISLKFDSCMLSGPGLSRILGPCENPISLTVRWRPGLWNDHLSNEPVGDAIREHGRRLEFLHLDTTDVYKYRYNSRGRSPPAFGSFAPITNLRTLAVPRYAFPLENCSVADILSILPSTLQKLYVLGIGNEKSEEERARSDAFAETCHQVKYHLPGLENIYMVPLYHFSLHEYGGEVHHSCINYEVEAARGLSFKRIS